MTINNIQDNNKYHQDLEKGELHLVSDMSENLHWRKMDAITYFIIWHERFNVIFREQKKYNMILVWELLEE
jgi:hypothetical protein